jgi:hypothetical protein
VQESQEHDSEGDYQAIVARLREELGGEPANVPAPPAPARPPTRMGRLRTRLSVAVWRFRGALPESVKSPLRRLLRRPAPAAVAQSAEPSQAVRSVEDLQVAQVELARRVSELEQKLAALEGGEQRVETNPPVR